MREKKKKTEKEKYRDRQRSLSSRGKMRSYYIAKI